MKFTESPVNGRPVRRDNMPIHLNGVLMSTQFHTYRPPMANMSGMGHRTSSLEMLNNGDFEEKRAFIASTLSLNDLLKPSQDYRSPQTSQAQFSTSVNNGYPAQAQVNNGYVVPQSNNGYVVPQSLLKPNTNGYNVNFLNNGVPDKDLGKKANGVPRSNSLGSATPPIQRKSRLHAFGRLFKPWKWKRKKKSEKFEAASKSLERKISVRTSKEELIQRGILLPMEANPSSNSSNKLGNSSPSPHLPSIRESQSPSPRPNLPQLTNNNKSEPNKEKTEHSNGSVPSGDGGGGGSVVNHSPKSCGMLSPGSGAPAGSVALPGLTGHRGHDNGVSVTVSNGSSYNGTRTVYSPEAESPPTPQPPPAPGSTHHHRPVSLNSVKGGTGKSGGKRTRWLLCYHMGGGAPSASPSPPSEHGNSQCSTPSPTDHGFKLPNSFSNERPTSLPVALLNCSGSSSGQPDAVVGRGVVVNEAVNPLSIDPNERVTPSGHGQHNGDIHDSIGVTDIGVIPPPPMFSSPSPPQPQRHIIPPPKEHQSHPPPPFGVTNARGHDLSDQHAKEMYSDEEEEEDCDEEADDDFVDLPPGVTRVVTTVPAKEPRLDAQPLKPALKQPKGSSRSQAGTPPSQNGRHHASTPPQDKHQNSSLGGGRRGAHPQFSNFREDKENIPHSDDDEDGPILYRDDDNMEDEDRLAAKLARKESLSQKLQQRPGRQELIDRNILYQVTEEERKVDRSIIGAKLIRRLSLRPTAEELEERNILKKKDDEQSRIDRERKETVPATKT